MITFFEMAKYNTHHAYIIMRTYEYTMNEMVLEQDSDSSQSVKSYADLLYDVKN